MAKRNYRKSRKKIQPAPLTFNFATFITNSRTGEQPVGTYYIDLSQVASLVNRRSYRQGLQWAVKSIKIASTVMTDGLNYSYPPVAPSGVIAVSKLPSTWVMSNAWEKGFRAWNAQQKEALENGSESLKPKYMDFKIHMDEQHIIESFGNNLLPTCMVHGVSGPRFGNQATAGEWVSSVVVTPEGDGANPSDTNEYEIMATGPNFGVTGTAYRVSLIDGYAASRAIGANAFDDPNRPADMTDASGFYPDNWLQAMTNQGTTQDDDVLTNLSTDNNIAPYPFENDGTNTDTMYPNSGNQLNGLEPHAWEPITSTTIGGMTYIGGGTFPCGLIRLDIQNFDESSGADGSSNVMRNLIQVELVPGEHKGYLCESMVEM